MKTILYTGATSGIAKEVIKKIKESYFIYVGVHTNKQLSLMKEKYKNEKNIKVIKLDIKNNTDLENIKKLDIDILISNAAIGYGGSISEIDMNLVRENFEVNVFSNFKLIQIVLKRMIKKGKGKIIIMSSIAGIMPLKFLGVYCATKASINKLTQALNKEIKLLNNDIKIKLIMPGMYKTGFNQIMLENKYKWMEKESIFKNEIDLIRKKENIFWNLLERKNMNSIIKQIINAINNNNNKLIYSAPKSQKIFAKLYSLFVD